MGISQRGNSARKMTGKRHKMFVPIMPSESLSVNYSRIIANKRMVCLGHSTTPRSGQLAININNNICVDQAVLFPDGDHRALWMVMCLVICALQDELRMCDRTLLR